MLSCQLAHALYPFTVHRGGLKFLNPCPNPSRKGQFAQWLGAQFPPIFHCYRLVFCEDNERSINSAFSSNVSPCSSEGCKAALLPTEPSAHQHRTAHAVGSSNLHLDNSAMEHSHGAGLWGGMLPSGEHLLNHCTVNDFVF